MFGVRSKANLTVPVNLPERKLTDKGSADEMVEAFARAVGTSRRREAPRLVLPGPDQLTVDGGARSG